MSRRLPNNPLVPAPSRARGSSPPTANPRLYAQTRKVLAKHYRTKYGVRQRLRGRKP
ncbi:MAG TPA: hypothetical protein VNK67_06800 [Burkholderiales bacterium]|nr:hypothetical protein [Burkholderiales bacterium]